MAPVFWAVTGNGKKIPIDGEPHPEGNIAIDPITDPMLATVLAGKPLADARTAGEKLHRTHFVTCKQRDQWSKRS